MNKNESLLSDLFPSEYAISLRQRVVYGVAWPLALLIAVSVAWALTPWADTVSARFSPGSLLLFGAIFCGPFIGLALYSVTKIGWPRPRYAFFAGLAAILVGLFGGAVVLLIMSLLVE